MTTTPLTAQEIERLDSAFLCWVAERIEYVYGESRNVDFLHRLRKVIENTKQREAPAPLSPDEHVICECGDAKRCAECETEECCTPPSPTADEVREALGVLQCVLDGKMSGRFCEWPQLAPAIRTILRAVRAPRLTGEQRDFVTDCDELVAAWDWRSEDTYDRSMSVVSDAIEEVRKSRIAFAADLAGEVDRG